jgi:pyrophosphatase PpaX
MVEPVSERDGRGNAALNEECCIDKWQQTRRCKLETLKRNLKDINTLLFDLDGTLLDSREFLLGIQFSTLEKYCPGQYSYEHVVENFGNVFHEMLGTLNSESNQIAIEEFCTAKLAGYHKYSPPFPGVIPGLQALRERGFKLGVITNQQKEPVHNALQAYGMVELFDVIIALEDVEKRKPSPEGIAAALVQVGADISTAAMVGDSHVDIHAAKNAGVVSVLLNWYEEKHALSHGPDLVWGNFDELLAAFMAEE